MLMCELCELILNPDQKELLSPPILVLNATTVVTQSGVTVRYNMGPVFNPLQWPKLSVLT